VSEKKLLDRKTILNHAFVFRCDPETMAEIRDFILDSGTPLVYQKHSFARLYIIEEGGSGSLETNSNNH
jgi:hypothetical protein